MTDATILVLDTSDLEPIQPSGFVPPSQRTSYSDPLVQCFLAQAFGGLFPKLESIEKNAARYRQENPEDGPLRDCVIAQSMDDIPQAEIMRLLQGWITLRRIVMETTAPEGVRSLLMNLRIPDPRVAPHFYRVSNPAGGDRKLHILTGFQGPSAPSMTLEEGIATMLDVKPSQLESLLATSMAPSPSTTPLTSPDVGVTNAPPAVAKSSGVKNVALLFSSIALLLFAVGIVWKLSERPTVSPASPQVATAPQPAIPAPAAPAVSPAPEVVVSAEPAKAAVAPQPAQAPLPTLDAMNTGMPAEESPSRATSQQSSNADLNNLMVR